MFGKLLLTAIVAAALASAQRGGGMGEGEGGEFGGTGGIGRGTDGVPGMSGMRPPQRLSKPEQIAEKLKLNKQQKEEFQNILSAGREEAAPVRQKMDNARVQIAGALIQGMSDADLKKLSDDYAALAAQMTAIETKAFSKLYASLKPNQQSKVVPAFE